MVSVVATALGLVSQGDATAFGRDKYNFRGGGEERRISVCERGDEDGRSDGAGAIHAFLRGERRLFERLSDEVSGCYDDDIEVGYVILGEKGEESVASVRARNVDAGYVGNVFR
jgi:hypothetical protein